MHYRLLLTPLLFTLISCTLPESDYEPDAMRVPGQKLPATRQVTQENPETLPEKGWFAQAPEFAPSTLSGSTVNDVWGETVFLQQELGFEQDTELDGRDALAEVFLQEPFPTTAMLPMVDQVSTADMDIQVGHVTRVGNRVGIYGALAWTNINAPIDNTVAEIHLPWEVVTPVFGTGVVSSASSNFQTDNVLGPQFEVAPTVAGNRIKIFGSAGPGTAVGTVKIGDGDGVGQRLVQFFIWYNTNGVRNTDWPLGAWTEITAIHQSLGGVRPTIIKWRVDGAQPGDFVRLFKDDPTPVHVPGGDVLVANTPKERGQFNLTSIGGILAGFPGEFYVEINGFLSPAYTVT